MFRISPAMHASGTSVIERSARPPLLPPTECAATPMEVGFRAWVEGSAKADVLIVGTCDPTVIPLEHALRGLLTSTQPLAPADGRVLGLATDVTIGTAAAQLLQACTDPDGPHCRSYRSATYFLLGRALLERGEDTEGSCAPDSDIRPRSVTA